MVTLGAKRVNMRRPDILSVFVIAILAGVVMTMFFQGAEPISSVQAAESYDVMVQGWGQIRPEK